MIHPIFISPYLVAALAGIALLLAALMNELSKRFVTLHVFIRRFKIFDLEFAATPLELATYVNGIFSKEMPATLTQKSSYSIKYFLILSIVCQVLIAVIFFCTCYIIAMPAWGFRRYFLLTLAWLQVASLACGIFRALFFLQYIRKDARQLSQGRFSTYQFVEIIKWAVPLITGVVLVSLFLSVWFSGNANPRLVDIVMLFVAEIFIVFLASKYLIKIEPVELALYREVGN